MLAPPLECPTGSVRHQLRQWSSLYEFGGASSGGPAIFAQGVQVVPLLTIQMGVRGRPPDVGAISSGQSSILSAEAFRRAGHHLALEWPRARRRINHDRRFRCLDNRVVRRVADWKNRRQADRHSAPPPSLPDFQMHHVQLPTHRQHQRRLPRMRHAGPRSCWILVNPIPRYFQPIRWPRPNYPKRFPVILHPQAPDD